MDFFKSKAKEHSIEWIKKQLALKIRKKNDLKFGNFEKIAKNTFRAKLTLVIFLDKFYKKQNVSEILFTYFDLLVN